MARNDPATELDPRYGDKGATATRWPEARKQLQERLTRRGVSLTRIGLLGIVAPRRCAFTKRIPAAIARTWTRRCDGWPEGSVVPASSRDLPFLVRRRNEGRPRIKSGALHFTAPRAKCSDGGVR